MREALRDKTAAELERDGRQVLARIGVAKATIEAFYANAILTPTDKAIIVKALEVFTARAGAVSSWRARRKRARSTWGISIAGRRS